jgi:hypothetical protein
MAATQREQVAPRLTADQYRSLVERCRAVALGTSEPDARAYLQRVAERLEKAAAECESRRRGAPTP